MYEDDEIFGSLWQKFNDISARIFLIWQASGDHEKNHKVYVTINGETKAVGFAHELCKLPVEKLEQLIRIYFPGEKNVKWEALSSEERNLLVHMKVMKRSPDESCPAYTTSLDAAWQVVREVNKPDENGCHDRYASFIDHLINIVKSDLFFDLFYCNPDDLNDQHLTAERICLAALRASGD